MNEFGKIPPQAIDLEQAVLGSMLQFSEVISDILDILLPENFYKDAHSLIYKAILKLYNENLPVDILTVSEELRRQGNIEIIGGAVYLTKLCDPVQDFVNSEYHARIVLQKSIQRKVIEVCHDAIKNSYEDTVDPLELTEGLLNSVEKINDLQTSGKDPEHISIIVKKSLRDAQIREKQSKEGHVPGIKTGILKLDKITAGWQNGDLIINAGRPGMGKTALMLFFARQCAKDGTPCAIFSLEMSDVKLTDRIILSECDMSAERFKGGYMSKEDWDEFYKAKSIIEKLPIYIDDKAVVSMRYIKSKASRLKKRGQCGMIFIDYLGLTDMKSENKGRNRENEVSEASRQAKIMAKSLDVPVMLLSQLSREVEKRPDKKPILPDLRESGSLEQDSDVVMFVYRPEYYDIPVEGDDGMPIENTGELIIAKNRNGATGTCYFKHSKNLMKIYDTELSDPLQTKSFYEKDPF
ncbi:MAG: replicative DNA helicase [Candidatus Paceibacterota bacterium]